MVGDGTGLGLSLTYNIVQEHGGSISVSNGARGGCRFEILLPGIDAAMAAEA
jgi:signal transduction histidine kinase